ncbi:PspC domain-containing protein [Microbacterium azadirachtae]|uniref:DNA-binding transcriptional activator PspC n=1 Tax=Microbacterium azadirachtae TaxID=582680 RepID=A0A0F0KWT1_9MICO|nr:PspC domain-containing protein [Microbacterium azadirachtae]KJL25367.1 DNA-binding transcriptional activator PspC [Microbacterium azadirachtae]UXW86628.1 PspC domain-containing protein [Microbacterium azadirachtae]SDL85186.1 Phage shock protein PspC (stress-responsive transcriptional regulator) [Microbacterium azadirachtae]SEG21795.1 Phage shock protein PspC (stress-responsive transcriptional regulator) [Microbacterium azadirachtae]SEG24040.1 Phage shock protein PspC (stress-responsive tran
MSDLVRPRKGRFIAGVCAGLARRFGMPVALVRIIAIVAMIFAGLPLWVYLVLWILIPSER